jgi:hypothetical protein
LIPVAQDDLVRAVSIGVGENADPRMRREVFEPGEVVGQREIGNDREACGLVDRSGDALRLDQDVVVIVTDAGISPGSPRRRTQIEIEELSTGRSPGRATVAGKEEAALRDRACRTVHAGCDCEISAADHDVEIDIRGQLAIGKFRKLTLQRGGNLACSRQRPNVET